MYVLYICFYCKMSPLILACDIITGDVPIVLSHVALKCSRYLFPIDPLGILISGGLRWII